MYLHLSVLNVLSFSELNKFLTLLPYIRVPGVLLKTTVRITLYEVEIKEVDKAVKRVKINVKGYSDKYDEWRPYNDNSFPLIRFEPK